MIPGKIVKYEKGKHLKEIYSNVQKNLFTSFGCIMRGYDYSRCGQEEKQEKSFNRSYDKKEREKRNQV